MTPPPDQNPVPAADTMSTPPESFLGWVRSDPRGVSALLVLPFVLQAVLHEVRWHRAHDYHPLSPRGTFAYLRANPARAVLGLAIGLVPDIVGAVVERGQDEARKS